MPAAGLKTSPADVLRAYAACLERLDSDGCVALLAEEAVLLAPFAPEPIPRRVEGAAEIGDLLRQVYGMFRSFAWVDAEVHATDDPELAVMLASSRIVLSNGDDYDQDYVVTVRAREGRIVECGEYFDPARAQRAMAAMTGA